MTRRARQHVAAPGQDSFLDIVSNLVGILIILVMVVGIRAKNAMVSVKPEPKPEETTAVDVETPRAAAAAVRADLDNVMNKIQRQKFEIAYRRKERDKMLEAIKTIEAGLQVRQQELDEKGRAEVAARQQILAANSELDAIKRQRTAVENAKAPPAIIEHLPTPLAKTVFGKELHFRLLDGRLAFVPLEQLVEKFQQEARQNLWKLKESPRFTDMVGPVRGFHLRYTLKRSNFVTSVGGSQSFQQGAELDHFVLLPISEDLGEPLDVALRRDSEFHAILSGHEPNHTTVTVWVYPDSFGQFRLLREQLYELGFLAASRPLPEGRFISGSPQGSRSFAQ